MDLEFDDWTGGEFPPLSSTDFPSPAPGVVDLLCQAPSNAGGSTTIAEAITVNGSLVAEIAELKTQLALIRQARDTAQAQVAHYRTYYSRSGW